MKLVIQVDCAQSFTQNQHYNNFRQWIHTQLINNSFRRNNIEANWTQSWAISLWLLWRVNLYLWLFPLSTAKMSFAPILHLASSLRTDPSQTKPEEPKSKLRGLVPSPPLLRIVLVFVIPALLSTLAIQVMQGNNVFFKQLFYPFLSGWRCCDKPCLA